MRLPIISAIADEWAHGDRDFPLTFVAALVLVWACAVMLWGLPALTLGAVALVPVYMILLIRIAAG
jgi:hypothetical protein